MTLPTDRLPSIDDVAAHLDITPASVRKIVRKHRVPVLSTGRHIRFDDIALAAFMEVLRCRSQSPVAATAAKPSTSRAVSTYRAGRSSEYANALRLTGSLSRARKRPRSKPESSATDGTASVVALAPSRRP